MAKKNKSKEQSAAPASNGAVDVGNMQFWREVGTQIIPKEKDDWHIGEVATVMRLIGDCVGKEWAKASSICDKSKNEALGLSIAVSIDRKNTPPTVKVSLGYSEKHKTSAESDVPDPNQTELPGISQPQARSEMTVPTAPVESGNEQ